MKWKIATATLAAVAIAAAPMAGAKPGNGNGNGSGTKPANQGQTISAIAKAGLTGNLVLAGGGVSGTVDLAPQGAGQGLKAAITANGTWTAFPMTGDARTRRKTLVLPGPFERLHLTVTALALDADA